MWTFMYIEKPLVQTWLWIQHNIRSKQWVPKEKNPSKGGAQGTITLYNLSQYTWIDSVRYVMQVTHVSTREGQLGMTQSHKIPVGIPKNKWRQFLENQSSLTPQFLPLGILRVVQTGILFPCIFAKMLLTQSKVWERGFSLSLGSCRDEGLDKIHHLWRFVSISNFDLYSFSINNH